MATFFRQRDYDRLRAALKIELSRIGEELVEYPQHLTECCELLGEALQEREQREYLLKEAVILAAAKIRADYEERQTRKPAEEAIKSEAALSKEAEQARVLLEDARSSVAFWSALVEGMRAKGSSLKRLAELTVSGFLAPNASYDTMRDEMAAARREAMPRRRPITGG